MESLQLSQVLADLSNLGAAEPEAAAAIVNANNTVIHSELARHHGSVNVSVISTPQQANNRPSMLKRAWSTEAGPVDKFGRRIMVASNSPRSGSAANSTPGTPRGGDWPVRWNSHIAY
jgi:hypothetical protein